MEILYLIRGNQGGLTFENQSRKTAQRKLKVIKAITCNKSKILLKFLQKNNRF